MADLRTFYLKYKPCIVKINVDEGAHVGTGFHIGDGLIATARHVLRKIIKPPGLISPLDLEIDRSLDGITRELDQQELSLSNVYYHSDKRVDLAILETDFETLPFQGDFSTDRIERQSSVRIPIGAHVDRWIADQFVLQKVLIMGYPRVPWSQSSALVTMEAEVNALVDNFRSPHPYFIVSSTARPGFSGAPVIGDQGAAIGIIVESLYGDEHENVGFNAAITMEPLVRILAERQVQPTFIDDDIWAKFLK